MADVLYDDEYKGPRYRYGLSHRPLAYASVPPGWIVFSQRVYVRYAFGTVDYPRLLTKEEVKSFELEFVRTA